MTSLLPKWVKEKLKHVKWITVKEQDQTTATLVGHKLGITLTCCSDHMGEGGGEATVKEFQKNLESICFHMNQL